LIKSFLAMVDPSGQEQESTWKGFPPHGTWLERTVKVEPSLHTHELGSTPLPQLGISYFVATLSATSSARNVFPCGQVQVVGLATPPHGFPLFILTMEAGMKVASLVHEHCEGGWPWQGLNSLLSTLLCMTGLLSILLSTFLSDPPSP